MQGPVSGTTGGGDEAVDRRKRAVNENVLPRPTALSIHSRPPINATSCAAIVNPKPVPP